MGDGVASAGSVETDAGKPGGDGLMQRGILYQCNRFGPGRSTDGPVWTRCGDRVEEYPAAAPVGLDRGEVAQRSGATDKCSDEGDKMPRHRAHLADLIEDIDDLQTFLCLH